MSNFDAVSVEVKMDEATLEDCITRGLVLREAKDNISWELGDLAILITDQFGPKFLNEFSKGIGIEVSTIRRYRDVAKAYSAEDREKFKMLSWTHFRMVAAQENRLELLEKAADNSWSAEKLGMAVKAGEDFIDDGEPVPPKPEMVFCSGCRKWGFANRADADDICPNDGSCEYQNK